MFLLWIILAKLVGDLQRSKKYKFLLKNLSSLPKTQNTKTIHTKEQTMWTF